MNVLSLFDGISAGRVALERAGIKVDNYYASEIDKYAIQVTMKNYPDTIQLGDVNQWDKWNIPKIDILIGGSPCQSLSIIQSQTRQNLDGKSKLFFKFVEVLNTTKPKYFLFENVASMTEETKNIISELLGCEPIFINSNCFSAQDRPRLYWTNIPTDISNLKECGLKLSDILEPKENIDEKLFYNYPLINVDMNKQVCATMDFNNNDMHKRIFNPNLKVHTLTTCGGGNTQKKVMINGRARKLTPLEYERLQTMPDRYTEGISNTQRYKCLGNSWTVDVIVHILKNINKERLKCKNITKQN